MVGWARGNGNHDLVELRLGGNAMIYIDYLVVHFARYSVSLNSRYAVLSGFNGSVGGGGYCVRPQNKSVLATRLRLFLSWPCGGYQ